MGVGSVLKELLKEKNIKVAELSRKTKIPPTTLYTMISQNYKKTDMEKLHKIADGIDMPFDEFLQRLIEDGAMGISFGDEETNKNKRQEIDTMLDTLNGAGIDEAHRQVSVLTEVPKYRK